jgi:choline dehydrogenase-like flavoprotein
MATNGHYDIAIIGTGAGGGTLAYALAPTGKRILLLERGGWLPREKENWDAREVFGKERYHTTEMWYDKAGRPFRPGTNYYIGGNTKVYGSILFRFRQRDFDEVRHHDGISPAWPLSYADFAPYYTKAEHLYSVHGQRGVDPTEPPAGDPFPHPPLRHEPRTQEIANGLASAGLHPFPLPVGIKLNEEEPHLSDCIRCNTFDGFPCLVNAKADAAVMCVLPAVRHPNVTLMAHAFVRRLETDASGKRVTKIHVERSGAREEFSADVVVSSCGAINSAALLLRSASDAHPHGLANGSDLVGRNYMCHNNTAALWISKTQNHDRFTRTVGVNDFYWGDKSFDYPMGHFSVLAKSLPEQLEGDAPSIRIPGVKLTLEQMALHAVDWWLTTEDLPHPDNRVEVTPDGHIMLSYNATNAEAHRQLIRRLHDSLEKIEGGTHFIHNHVYLSKKIPLAGVAHQCGTVRFGRDPNTSALDANCKAHEVDNLYVVDGGFFPSSSSVNPALTIMANALRVADHLRDRMA